MSSDVEPPFLGVRNFLVGAPMLIMGGIVFYLLQTHVDAKMALAGVAIVIVFGVFWVASCLLGSIHGDWQRDRRRKRERGY